MRRPAGPADLILAEHRDGPTATITVAHQLHDSRFVDIARSRVRGIAEVRPGYLR